MLGSWDVVSSEACLIMKIKIKFYDQSRKSEKQINKRQTDNNQVIRQTTDKQLLLKNCKKLDKIIISGNFILIDETAERFPCIGLRSSIWE